MLSGLRLGLGLLLACVLTLTVLPIAQVLADFEFKRVQTDCNIPCDQGGCAYVNCREPSGVACDGGACSFRNCVNARCKGGACLFSGCKGAKCAGGGCDFTDQAETLHADSCTGENCSLQGAALPVLHRGEYLTI